MNIGRRLKEERNLKGLSQQQLADAVGIKQSAISQLESGAS
jgi:transcriptional regulator with XRE-family HTH domain